MSDEYIKREDAIGWAEGTRDLLETPSGRGIMDAVVNALKGLPAAPVGPVVLCKECVFNQGAKKCLHPDSIIKTPADNDFCSYGKRKEAAQ